MKNLPCNHCWNQPYYTCAVLKFWFLFYLVQSDPKILEIYFDKYDFNDLFFGKHKL